MSEAASGEAAPGGAAWAAGQGTPPLHDRVQCDVCHTLPIRGEQHSWKPAPCTLHPPPEIIDRASPSLTNPEPSPVMPSCLRQCAVAGGADPQI